MGRWALLLVAGLVMGGCGPDATEPDPPTPLEVGEYDYHFRVGNAEFEGTVTITSATEEQVSGSFDVQESFDFGEFTRHYEPELQGEWKESHVAFQDAPPGFDVTADVADGGPLHHHRFWVTASGSVGCWAKYEKIDADVIGGSVSIDRTILPATCSMTPR